MIIKRAVTKYSCHPHKRSKMILPKQIMPTRRSFPSLMLLSRTLQVFQRVSLPTEIKEGPRNAFRGTFARAHKRMRDVFHEHDADDNGLLDFKEIQTALSSVTKSKVTFEQVLTLLKEFDKDGNGKIDMSEFVMMVTMLEEAKEVTDDFAAQITSTVAISKAATDDLLNEVSSKIYPMRDILCFKEKKILHHADEVSHLNDDFEPAFAPSEMRCLALVSHNEMKATMKEFVIANKNILKKFRLTGTNSTMTMLKEIFKGDSAVVFGPSCQSGPLGGDAELVALMCSGRLGGMLFFQDPMSAHPHQSDIECLCRQAMVHNTMVANTPCSAYMMMHTLRSALKGKGQPELIPSFFFSLQSPAVAAYKAAQQRVILNHTNCTAA